MKIRIFIQLLLLLSLILVGCKEEKAPEVPKEPEIPEVPEMPEVVKATLPIVFHVLYEDESNPNQNPDNKLFIERLEHLNKFYKDNSYGLLDIKFTFASHYPDGRAMLEPGINRVLYEGSSDSGFDLFYNNYGSLQSSLKPKAKEVLWDPNQYINIWVYDFSKVEGFTGMAFPPFTIQGKPLIMLSNSNWAIVNQPSYMHGIYLDTQIFTTNNDAFLLCHEIGHYLGLLHAFSQSLGGKDPGCTDTDNASDDGCSDTPKYSRTDYLNSIKQSPQPYDPYYRQPCNGGELFKSTNLMDYWSGTGDKLTPEQVARIRHVLAYSPWIPRSKAATKSLLENFSGEITDQRPNPIMITCPIGVPRGE